MSRPRNKVLEEKAGLRNARKGYGIQPTWPNASRLIGIPIDHILVSAQWDVLSFKVGENIGSDHFPVIVELQIRAEGTN